MFSKFFSPSEVQARKEKRRRFWRKARPRLFWTFAIVFVIHSTINLYGSILLNREYAHIRSQGDPMQFADIEPPAIPDSQNAAVVYKKATQSLKLTPEEKYAFNTRRSRMTPKIQATLDAALRKNTPALTLARQAASMPQCRFPLDWKSDPTRFNFPHYSELRLLARLLASDARRETRRGNTQAALQDVKAIFGTSYHLTKEPYYIGFLLASSIDRMGRSTLAEVLEHVPLTLTQAHAFQSALPDVDWGTVFRRSMVGERMMAIYAFESIGNISPAAIAQAQANQESYNGPFSWLAYPLLLAYRPVLKLDEIENLRLWRRLLDTPESQQIPRPADFAKGQTEAISKTPRYAMLTRILFPVFTNASDQRDLAQVQYLQCEVALALNAYRTVRGQYPATLNDAAKLWGRPLPLDPYSNQPFRYRRDGTSFTLYSVGTNRIDDGGKDSRTLANAGTSDAEDLIWLNSLQAERSFMR